LQQEIEVDVCPLCQGIWLDRNELDQLLAAALWEVDRYAARMAELPNVAAATKTEVSVSRSELDRRVGLQREGQTGDPEPGRVAPQPSLGEVLSRFKNNFGRFFRRLKQTG
jgi:Zn-finger nucleic acid-binding protein